VTERRGWLVRCEVDGQMGYGDCAPLPGAGTETDAAAWAWLCAWRDRSLGWPLETALEALSTEHAWAPAAQYAAECALADLAAQRAGMPLARWLAPATAPTQSVPINAVLGNLAGLRPEDLATSAAKGCWVFKIKVGVYDLDWELRRLTDLAKALPPDGRFRLDANGAWTQEQASRALAILAPLPIEALEEPLSQPTAVSLKALQAQVGFPLALDESLTRPGAWPDLATIPVRRLVLKPAALGGLRRTLALARAAQAVGLEVVVTSLIESAAGVWPTLHLAAVIASSIPQGLATADWLAQDLGEAPSPRDGRIQLPICQGSGFRPWASP
jgi:o-succinylbenzoate synthase